MVDYPILFPVLFKYFLCKSFRGFPWFRIYVQCTWSPPYIYFNFLISRVWNLIVNFLRSLCASISDVLFSFRLTESWRMNAGAVTRWGLFYVHDISHNAGSVTTHSRGFKYVT
jgi:hypothetical protein